MAILRVVQLFAGESEAVDDDAELLATEFIKETKGTSASFILLLSEDEGDIDDLFAGLGGED